MGSSFFFFFASGYKWLITSTSHRLATPRHEERGLSFCMILLCVYVSAMQRCLRVSVLEAEQRVTPPCSWPHGARTYNGQHPTPWFWMWQRQQVCGPNLSASALLFALTHTRTHTFTHRHTLFTWSTESDANNVIHSPSSSSSTVQEGSVIKDNTGGAG